MSLTNSPIWFGSGATGGDFYDYEINDSLRFNDNDTAYLNRTPSSAGNRKTFTFSAWVKRANLGINTRILGTSYTSSSEFYLRFKSNDTLEYGSYEGGGASNNFQVITTQVFRDVSAWYHIVFRWDTTQSTAANRLRIYVNGEQITAFSTANYPSQNYDGIWNNTVNQHRIGYGSSGEPFDGYMAELNSIDGQSLDPTSFGQTKSGVWIPKSYGGSYGTNGFHLNFSNNSTATNLGLDSSGNSNNWSVNGISTTDQMIDTPTNNFGTFNPLMYRWASNTTTLSEGNLKSTGSSGYAFGTINIPTSGKWYYETYTVAGTSVGVMGVGDGSLLQNNDVSNVVYYFSNGNKSVNGTVTAYGATWTTGDVIGVACDADSNTVTFYKNGSSQGSISYDPSEKTVFFGNWGTTGYFVLNHGQDSTFAGATTAGGNSDANGRGDFKYAVPSAHLALCTANLTEPTIIDASEYFNTLLYSGNGGTQSITGVGFQPDFVWLKGRNFVSNHRLNDVVRGASNSLKVNTTSPEDTTSTNYVTSFDSDGFSLSSGNGDVNQSGGTFASWNWKAGGAAVSNTAGSITSQVSANVDAGFSVVSYASGSSGNKTVGHGLGATPTMIFTKSRDATSSFNWSVYHKDTATTVNKYLIWNGVNSLTDNGISIWGAALSDTNANTFGIRSGNGVNANTNCIAYCFADVEGYSKAGSYIGGGSNFPFVFTGFRPAWVLIKSYTAGYDWVLDDAARSPYNEGNATLYPNDSYQEYTGGAYGIDFLSNGFKPRTSYGQYNQSGGGYIYLAFAENPFKYANAR